MPRHLCRVRVLAPLMEWYAPAHCSVLDVVKYKMWSLSVLCFSLSLQSRANRGMKFNIGSCIEQWSTWDAVNWYLGLPTCAELNYVSIVRIIIFPPIEWRPRVIVVAAVPSADFLVVIPNVMIIASEFHVKFKLIVFLRIAAASDQTEVNPKIAGHSFWFIFGRFCNS